MFSSMSMAGLSLVTDMSEAWFSGKRSVKSTNLRSSIFLNWVSAKEGGVKGLRNEDHGSEVLLEFIPVCCEG